jgi:TolB protein
VFWPQSFPDGKRIAFTCGEYWSGNEAQIWVANADGSEPIQLTTDPDTRSILPVWSPDGTFIAFNTDRYGEYELWVMKADGTDQAFLKAGPFSEIQWRP